MSKVTLSETEHRKLQRRIAKLDALEAGGVDNWDSFDDSLDEWRKEGEVDDLIDNAIDDLNDILVDADVDQPAGPTCGYSVSIEEQPTREMFMRLAVAYHAIMSGT